MANTVEKVRVHNAIIGLLEAGPYYPVNYTPATRLAADIDTAVDPTIDPISVQTNELLAAFTLDERYKRGRVLDRAQWVWVGFVKFAQEVTAYEAEELWLLSPPRLPRTPVFRQVQIDLIRTSYTHPTKQEGHSGSLIEFNFEIRLSRR